MVLVRAVLPDRGFAAGQVALPHPLQYVQGCVEEIERHRREQGRDDVVSDVGVPVGMDEDVRVEAGVFVHPQVMVIDEGERRVVLPLHVGGEEGAEQHPGRQEELDGPA